LQSSLEKLNSIVLHRRPYRETSYIVDIFTREVGKVAVVCKGVRGRKNDKKSLLQPFQPILVGLYGKHELKNLSYIEASSPMIAFTGNYLFSALYLNELLNRTLLAEVQYSKLFDVYLASLLRLKEQQNIETILREFESQLLSELGYQINFMTEAGSGDAILEDCYYTFISQYGFTLLAIPDNTKQCFAGKNIIKINNNQWDVESLHSAKILMRMAFQPLIGDKPLKSRELFRQTEQK
jgi:DNA repair protein RecO (recombination protein O)